jgi:hypothetical protein
VQLAFVARHDGLVGLRTLSFEGHSRTVSARGGVLKLPFLDASPVLPSHSRAVTPRFCDWPSRLACG